MSAADELSDVIAEAMAVWLADNGGGMVTSFAYAVEYLDADGDRCWAVAHADSQSPSQTLGLLRWHTLAIEEQCRELMGDEDE